MMIRWKNRGGNLPLIFLLITLVAVCTGTEHEHRTHMCSTEGNICSENAATVCRNNTTPFSLGQKSEKEQEGKCVSRRVHYEGCRNVNVMQKRTIIAIYAVETRNISAWRPIIITYFDQTVNDGNAKHVPDAGCMAQNWKGFRAMIRTLRDFALEAAVQIPFVTLNRRVPFVIEKWKSYAWITPARTHVQDMLLILWYAIVLR
ncbi:hypothetical protein GCK72_023348 [Caenorhabditis remanei]|uniref:Secreted protein n=1 Tax=Caenorhabditis remanei TaxID=31234 RepID=A0A6A5FW31_CAERE|nr:hypothetical protein GCK72_023348 [Caenorhabditis remanei]KAF1746890.1 hypothetical protein GCK72_023348 [Caenorhabditis remanei]